MTRRRIALIGDYLEERWPSMDLAFEMTGAGLEAIGRFDVVRVRPRMRRRLSGRTAFRGKGYTGDRFLARFLDYPAVVRKLDADVYHVIDHSYGHLVHALPPERTVVTCHDTDAFRWLYVPGERRGWPYSAMARRIASGMRRARFVTCDSRATRDELCANGLVEASRAVTVPLGVDPLFSVAPDPRADAAAAGLLGPAGPVEVLHVGSTIPRKRVDVLLRAFALIAEGIPEARLVRVGGRLTGQQARLARDLAIESRIVSLPFIDRDTLAAVYRRAAVVLLPSDREGFGFPVLEALACGAPMVASDLPVLREVGGEVVRWATAGDARAFADAALAAIGSRSAAGAARASEQASRFTWDRTIAAFAALYDQIG